MTPIVRVVGLGPSTVEHLTRRTFDLLTNAPVARLRTCVHPAASAFASIESYDEWYENADSFDELYAAIVEDLIRLARDAPNHEVLYAVPGSPSVAETTVELLRARDDVTTIIEPAVSVIDVVTAVLGRDAMRAGLRVVDALGSVGPIRGPGPLLILQTYSPEVLASVVDRLPVDATVTVVHHVGLEDEVVREVPAKELASFTSADHLTSLWVEELRGAGEAMDDLVELTRRLRAECPWDQEQTHASLTRHLLEEAYETIDALEALARDEANGTPGHASIDHVEEELGDLLFQVVLHAELGDEEGRFTLTTIADALREKLVYRHPHVFGDVRVSGSEDVASRWEVLKRDEKGRESVTDGIAWQLPALTLYTKLVSKALLVDVAVDGGDAARTAAMDALAALQFEATASADAVSSSDVASSWGDAVAALVSAARYAGVDLEGVLRERATTLREDIRRGEGLVE